MRESEREVRRHARTEANGGGLLFYLDLNPPANITHHRDFAGNAVHHFDIAGSHAEVKVTAQSTVQVQSASAPRPAEAGDWADLDASNAAEDHWEMLLPSQFAHSSEALAQLVK